MIQIPDAVRAIPERRRLLSFVVTRDRMPAITNKRPIGTMMRLIGENIRVKMNPKITPITPSIMHERQDVLTAFWNT
jgi:hypothetical protein